MKILFALVAALVAAPLAAAAEPPSAEVAAIGKRLDIVAEVSKFQGLFDSVVSFCAPHAPQDVMDRARDMWLARNKQYLELRDRELSRAIEDGVAAGADEDGIAFIRDWATKQYEGTAQNDRMYKDLVGSPDLLMACSRRLGEMNSEMLSIEKLAPNVVKYAAGAGEL